MTNQVTNDFLHLFSGLDDAHGKRPSVVQTEEVGKKDAEYRILPGPLTAQHLESHFSGKCGYGSFPIKRNNCCTFGAIDIDVYGDGEAQFALIDKIEDLLFNTDLYPLMCGSKSRGLHLFYFFKEDIPAKDLRRKLTEIANFLGFPPGKGNVDIFPHNDSIEADGKGKFISLPYFNIAHDYHYAAQSIIGGTIKTVEDFVKYAKKLQHNPQDFLSAPLPESGGAPRTKPQATTSGRKKQKSSAQKTNSGPLKDYPPCLQALFSQGIPEGMRNDVMAMSCVVAKKEAGDKWKTRLAEINTTYCKDPVDQKELDAVAHSYEKKEYGYSCGKEPFASHCDRAACLQRKFGIGPDAGQFTEVVRVDWPKKIYFVKYSYEIPGGSPTETAEKFICLSNTHPSKQIDVLGFVLAQTGVEVPLRGGETWALIVHDLMKTLRVIGPEETKEIIKLGDELADPVHKVLFPNLRIKTTTDYKTIKNRTQWIFDIQVPETVSTGEAASTTLRTKTVQLEERQLQARTYAEAVNNEGGINAFVACDQTQWGIVRAFAAAGAPRITPETESPEDLVIRCLKEMLSTNTDRRLPPKDFNTGVGCVKITRHGSVEEMFGFRTLFLVKLHNGSGDSGDVQEETINRALEDLSKHLGDDILTYKKRYTAPSDVDMQLDTKAARPEIHKAWVVNRNKFANWVNDADLNEFTSKQPAQAPVTPRTY